MRQAMLKTITRIMLWFTLASFAFGLTSCQQKDEDYSLLLAGMLALAGNNGSGNGPG